MCKLSERLVEVSKYLSYLLRHHPESIGLKMDTEGWVLVDDLIRRVNNAGVCQIDLNALIEIVKYNDKRRFALKESPFGLCIRASQGHSLKNIQIHYVSIKPPKVLYHGTGVKYIRSILKQGIKPKTRQYVHLSSNIDTAIKVGLRHGAARVFQIDAEQMYKDGVQFYLSENNVWLTSFVDKKYIHLI